MEHLFKNGCCCYVDAGHGSAVPTSASLDPLSRPACWDFALHCNAGVPWMPVQRHTQPAVELMSAWLYTECSFACVFSQATQQQRLSSSPVVDGLQDEVHEGVDWRLGKVGHPQCRHRGAGSHKRVPLAVREVEHTHDGHLAVQQACPLAVDPALQVHTPME